MCHKSFESVCYLKLASRLYKFICYRMSLKPADEYIHKLNEGPQQTRQILHSVRELDKRVLKMHIDISAKREQAIQKIASYQRNKSGIQKTEIEELLKTINTIHKRMIKLTKQKKELVERLYNIIDEPTEELERDLSKFMPELMDNELKESKNRRHKKDHEQFNSFEPSYCYCKRPSYGLMIQCENKGCQIQWFHTECVDESSQGLKDKWYCRDCRKTRQKKRT